MVLYGEREFNNCVVVVFFGGLWLVCWLVVLIVVCVVVCVCWCVW